MSDEEKPGFYQAADLLSHLSIGEREKILSIVSKADSKLADRLKKSLFSFEDLIHLTPKMMPVLVKNIDPSVLGLALRGTSESVRNHFLQTVSKGIRLEIEEVLNGRPKPVNQVQDAMGVIMDKVQNLIDSGEIILSKDGNEKIID